MFRDETNTWKNVHCEIVLPFIFSVGIVQTTKPVKSIEIQLIRIEDIPKGESRHVSEVQNIQVANGNVLPGMQIPLYMVLPRYFSCPSKFTSVFGIHFEVNICVIFADNLVVSENIPITLYR